MAPLPGVSLFALMQKVTKKIKAVEPTIAIGVKILAWPWASGFGRVYTVVC